MAEKVEVDIEVQSNLEPSLKSLRELKKELKAAAAGSAEFKQISQNIKEVEDALEESRAGAKGFKDMLEEAPGPLGGLFKGLRQAEIATKGFGTALKATGIGLIVAAIGGLVAAFSNVEGATKKLEPLMIGFEKILGGIFRAMEPLIDAFLELALQALPYITKGISVFYSGLFSLFTLVKNVGVSVGKILKGVFTLDFDALKEGAAGIKDAFTNVGKTFTDTMERFEAGTKELTKTEKKNADERKKLADEAAKKAAAEAERLRKEKEARDKAAADAQLAAFLETLEDRDREEYQAGLKQQERLAALRAAGITDTTLVEEAYQKELADIRKKFDDKAAEEQKKKDEKDKADLLKSLQEKRDITAIGIQSQIDELDRLNAKQEFDFQADIERIRQKRVLLDEAERNELSNTELTEAQRLAIQKKYSDERIKLTDQELATESAALAARQEMNMMYLDSFAQFGSLLQQIAGKSKGIAIAGIVIEQASSIARIVANTAAGLAKLTPGLPFTAPAIAATKISAALGIASTIAAATKSIQQINATNPQNATATVAASGPPPSFAGAPTSIGAPQIQTGGGQGVGSQIAQSLAAAQQKPIQAFVVSQAVSSQQALDRRTNSAATFTGG
jgi:hypothetical protein